MWQPIAGADLARDCWTTIADIERVLADNLPLQPHVAGGTSGVALFFAYLHAAGGSDAAADRALHALELSGGALAEEQLLPSLYSGFAGVGWVLAHLTRELFDGDADLTVEIDRALRAMLSEETERAPFELVGGLAGYGSYLIERLPSADCAELLDRVITLLDASRDVNGVWFSDPEWLPEWQRDLMPRGHYNLGVAHGIAGVIGFLAAAQQAGVRDPRIARMVNDAVPWLLAQKGIWPSSLFPSHVPPDSEPRPTRTAWCYGDLGVAAVLLSAGLAFEREEWRDEAVSIARVAARRTLIETKVSDAGLCHGASGVAHLFNRISQATDDVELRDAALRWYAIALHMRQPGKGLAGFLSWYESMLPGERGSWRGEAGFLTGIAGIGLALLAAVTDIEPTWDRVMLVSVPPRVAGYVAEAS
ncbi:MAG TPA: lanthionine synthetase C family protein [Thermoanaerobaculia bacterium]|nr:lanthionine synthetase C family protein [Thermoanaerobaculia bacterium]